MPEFEFEYVVVIKGKLLTRGVDEADAAQLLTGWLESHPVPPPETEPHISVTVRKIEEA